MQNSKYAQCEELLFYSTICFYLLARVVFGAVNLSLSNSNPPEGFSGMVTLQCLTDDPRIKYFHFYRSSTELAAGGTSNQFQLASTGTINGTYSCLGTDTLTLSTSSVKLRSTEQSIVVRSKFHYSLKEEEEFRNYVRLSETGARYR